MKIFFRCFAVASLLFLSACGDNKEEETGSPAANKSHFANILGNMENPVAAMRFDVMQVLKKTGLMENDETGLIIENALEEYEKAFNLKEPLRVAVEMREGDSPWIVGMIGVNDRKKFKSFVSSINVKFEDSKNGYDIATKEVEQYRVLIGFNDHICLIAFSPQFTKKADYEAYLDGLFNPPSDKKPEGLFSKFAEGTEDLALVLKPGMLSKIAPEKEMKDMYGILYEGNEDAAGYLTLNFIKGAIEITQESDFSEDSPMTSFYNENGLPDEFASYLTNDELIGYGGGSFNMEKMFDFYKNLFDSFDDPGGDKEEMTEMISKLEDIAGALTGEVAISMINVKGFAEGIKSDMEMEEEFEDIAADDSFDALNDEDDAYYEDDDFLYEDEYEEDVDWENYFEAREKNDKETAKNVLLIVGMKDAGLVESVLDTVSKLSKQDGIYQSEDNDLFILLMDNKLILCADLDVIQDFKDGDLKKSEEALEYMSSPMFGFFDFKKLYSMMTDVIGTEEFEGSNYLKLLNKAYFNANLNKGKFILEMNNKNKNSLRQIIDIIMEENSGDMMQMFM